MDKLEASRREMDGTLDWEALEKELLTPQQRSILARDSRRGGRPRWDLDPPQRESYNDPISYVLGLGHYADRVLQDEGR